MPKLRIVPSMHRFLAAALVCLAVAAQPLRAQVPPSNAAAVESARATLESSGLDEAQRKAAGEHLDAAQASEREADTLLERTAALRAEATAVLPAGEPRSVPATDARQALAAWTARLPADADADTLERLLDQERAALDELTAQADTVAGQLAQVLSRPGGSGDELADLRRRLDELSAPIAASDGEPAPAFEARRLRRLAEARRLAAELELRQTEQDTATQRQRALELKLRDLRQRRQLHEPRLAVLQQRIADLGRRELELLRDQAIEQETRLAAVGGATAVAAVENRALAENLVEANERLVSERDALATFERARERVAATLRDSRTRLELGGTSEQVGRWLWSERRALEAPALLHGHLDEVRYALGETRLRLVDVSEQQRELGDIGAVMRALREADPAADDEGSADVAEHALEPLLLERADLLSRLAPLLQRRIAALEQSESALRDQLDDTLVLQQTLDRHLLWIPSHAPVGPDWLRRVPAGLYDLVKPARFVTTAELIARSFTQRPLAYLASVLAVLVLLILRRRARPRIEALALPGRQVQLDRYRYTLEAAAWTALAALPWALAAWLFGHLLQGVGETGKYSDSLGRALTALALPVFTFRFMRWLCIERGLGHAHFRWTRPRREALRRGLPRLEAVLLPAYFVIALAFVRNLDLAIDVQARLAIVVLCAVAAWLLWRLLAAGALWTPRGMTAEPSLLRKALRVLLPALLIACAVLALAGYVYSAATLLRAQLASVGVVLLVAVIHGLLARWSLLGERRLALHRLEQRREAAQAEAADTGEAIVEPEAEIALETVNAHTRRLLRALRLSLLALGLIWVWSEVLPAFARLDDVALWHFSATGPDGARIDQPVTLMAVLLGVLALALTVVAARNLPGLIEIGLLSRVNVDAASRYAITSVSRYAIVIAGVIVGLGLLGLRWSQLQWMAAALTVGLGFGLQEIFANFVSGLILLFERPFRVGDVITIGDLSGTVTRIRTRATTILDFDNKEIVVPNKTFITGQLINWTLTDTTTRITIKVGVAYGSDVAQVHALLMQAAHENPRVLADPAPRTWFLAFGASSLDFELRVFVGTLADRLTVQNELNGRVAELLGQAGVSIAFPQLDVHVRDLPPAPAGDAAAAAR